MKAAIIHGYVPPDASEDELDVLVEAEAVANGLKELGHNSVTIPIHFDTQKAISDIRNAAPDFIFNLVESIDGIGKYIYLATTIYDYINIPYTGSKTDAMYATSNKLLAKRCLKSAGILTPEWYTLASIDEAENQMSDSFIIKSVWEHASIGLDATSIVNSKNQIKDALMKRARANENATWFAEKFIDGREFNISVIGSENGPQVLPPAEMVFQNFPDGKPKIVDYRAKWDESSYEYQNTIRTFETSQKDEKLLNELAAIATKCWHLFELKGYVRVDFRVDENNNPWVLEVNVNPCVSPDAGFFAACKRSGLTYSQVIERIIADSIQKK